MKKRDKFYITILFLLPILFVLCVSTYSMYGSKLDWLSQHISLADDFRQTQQLLPDSFENLQGQTNAFSFSYYGLLRPDVLVSYLFPNIPIHFFIIGYATLLWLSTGGLCYYWLRNKGYKDSIRFFFKHMLHMRQLLLSVPPTNHVCRNSTFFISFTHSNR